MLISYRHLVRVQIACMERNYGPAAKICLITSPCLRVCTCLCMRYVCHYVCVPVLVNRRNATDLLELSYPVTSLFPASEMMFLTNVPSLLFSVSQGKTSFRCWLAGLSWTTFQNRDCLILITKLLGTQPPQRRLTATYSYSVGPKASIRNFCECTVH